MSFLGSPASLLLRGSSRRDLVPLVALEIKEGFQIGVVDARARRGGDARLGAEGDAETRRLEHRQVVCAVADGERIGKRDAMLGREKKKRLPLGLAPEDRLFDPAKPAFGKNKAVGENAVETEFGGNPFGKKRKTARDEGRHGSLAAHRRNQSARSRHEPHAPRRLFENGERDPAQKGDAGFERAGKIDFPVHRAPGDCGNLGEEPEIAGDLVEHFVFDKGRFEVGEEHPFAPRTGPLHDEIDRLPAQKRARLLLDKERLTLFDKDLAGFSSGKPERLGAEFEGGGASRAGERGGLSAAQERQDKTHPRPPLAPKPSPGALPLVVLAGPTASGKSALAEALAETIPVTIINADSQQVYRDLRILTARPEESAEARVPHRLYGYLDAALRSSAGLWRALAEEAIAQAAKAGRLPLLVGGSGLYLRALEEGLAPIPAIPEETREEARLLYQRLGGEEFRKRLSLFDRDSALRLHAADKARLLRAYEVVRATGLAIGLWRRQPLSASPYHVAKILLLPPRERLYARSEARFAAMIEKGALAEAARILARGLDPSLPAMKVTGLRELFAHLKGEASLEEAILAAKRATRRYAKRQSTWFRHQFSPDCTVRQELSPQSFSSLRRFIEGFSLTGKV